MSKPNYYVILPSGVASTIYIKDIEAAKKVMLAMNEKVKLVKIKR
jgi:hypothetical protein